MNNTIVVIYTNNSYRPAVPFIRRNGQWYPAPAVIKNNK